MTNLNQQPEYPCHSHIPLCGFDSNKISLPIQLLGLTKFEYCLENWGPCIDYAGYLPSGEFVSFRQWSQSEAPSEIIVHVSSECNYADVLLKICAVLHTHEEVLRWVSQEAKDAYKKRVWRQARVLQ